MLKSPFIVVGGSAYADIDVLACVQAYKQFLQLQGHVAHSIITGPWNQTIPSSVKNWQIGVEKQFPYPNTPCNFVLVDFSDPKYVDTFVDLEFVEEVFDHHYGHEEYWKDRIGEKAKIEKIGACATLIWEKFKEAKIEDQISTVNANLLCTAIMANTLDFKSQVTERRDIIAAQELLKFTNLPSNWKEIYYMQVEEEFLKNSLKNILEDTKNVTIFETPFNFGQIELKSAKDYLVKSTDIFKDLGTRVNSNNQVERWLVNIVSIEENCSYLYSNCPELKEILQKITNADPITDHISITKRLWLRKELMKEMHLYCIN